MKFRNFFLIPALLAGAASAEAGTYSVVDAGTMNPAYAGSQMFIPDDLGPNSLGVVLLHGSTVRRNRPVRWVGLPEFLAENGMLVFELCYFECPGNSRFHPYSLIDYDLRETYDALAWFQSLPIYSGRFGIYGLSRGAEQAMLLSELMGRENLPVQPKAVIAHSPITYIWGSFDWRWVDESYGCWRCADGGTDCFQQPLSDDDRLYRRHLAHNPESRFLWNENEACGPNPRDLDLTESVSYRWRGTPIPVARQWAKVGPAPLVNLSMGYKLDPTFYSSPYMFLHGGRDATWSADFSKSFALQLKAFALGSQGGPQLDIRPVASYRISDDGAAETLAEFTSGPRTGGPFAEVRTWHRFHLIENADHVFSDPRHSEIRKRLTLEFLREQLRRD